MHREQKHPCGHESVPSQTGGVKVARLLSAENLEPLAALSAGAGRSTESQRCKARGWRCPWNEQWDRKGEGENPSSEGAPRPF